MQDPKGRNYKAKPLRVQAMTRNFPPQSGQVSISMANTRFSRCIQLNGAVGLSLSTVPRGRCGTMWATYLRQGNPERALAEMNELPYSHTLNSQKAEALFMMGREKESRALTSDFLNTTPAEFGPYAKAMIYAWRGENDDAFKSLELAFEQHNHGLANILLNEAFRLLEDDPRYPIFLEKFGLLKACSGSTSRRVWTCRTFTKTA